MSLGRYQAILECLTPYAGGKVLLEDWTLSIENTLTRTGGKECVSMNFSGLRELLNISIKYTT